MSGIRLLFLGERGLGVIILLSSRLNVCLTCMSLAFDVSIILRLYCTRLPLLSLFFFRALNRLILTFIFGSFYLCLF